MFQRILVPLDDATRPAAALRIASCFAQQTGAQLVLVHTELSAVPAQRVIGARAALQRHVTFLRRQGIQAEYVVEIGSHEDGIVAAANARQVDLILLVPVLRQRLELLWYARSATRLLNELPAPLLIWPESQTSVELLASHGASVMVPLDEAPEAERSLPFAKLVAERYHRPLVLVRAVPIGTDEASRSSVRGPDRLSDRIEAAETRLKAIRAILERTTTEPIQTLVVAGEPGTQLLQAVKNSRAGIIVLCPHSHPTKERYFLGCVATQLLHRAEVPILVVPPKLGAMLPAMDHRETVADHTQSAVEVTL